MRASVQNDMTERVITLEVSGVPDLDVTENWHHKDRTIRPDFVEITLMNGEFHQLVASGPLLTKDGTPGRMRGTWKCARTDARYERRTLDKAPQWVQTLIAGLALTHTPAEVSEVRIYEHSSGALILDVD